MATMPPAPVHAGAYSVNSVRNGNFEGGVDTYGLPIYWQNVTNECHCQPAPTITVNNTEAIYNNAARLDIGKASNGFMGVRQFYPQNTLFSNFTQRQDELDFWFRLDPKYDGLGDFRIRLQAQNGQELNYVIDPDTTFLTYPNDTFTYGDLNGQPSLKYIFLGRLGSDLSTPLMAPPSKWVHFTRDVTADWLAPMRFTGNSTCTVASPCTLPGFPLDDVFSRLEFGLQGYQNSDLGTQYGMTAWIDNVNFYWNSNYPAPPPPMHFLKFNFTDLSKTNVDQSVKWRIFNATSDIASYTRGAQTLPDGDYTLEAYYPTITPPYLIYRARIPFDTNITITLSLLAEPMSPGTFVAFFPSVLNTTRIEQDSTRLAVDVKATTGTSYAMFAKVPYLPKAIVKTTSSRVELVPGVDWTYDAAQSIATLTSVTPALYAIYLQEPVRVPTVTFTDRAGTNVNNLLVFNMTNSRGKLIPIVQHQITPDENYPYYLQAFYQGHRTYRDTVDFGRTSPIQLPMLPLSSGYLVVNSTVVGINIIGQSDNSLKFDLTGPGPFLILVGVPQKPLYIELNGAKIFWSYDATSRTVIIETPTQGTVSLLYTNPPQQPPPNSASDYTNYYIAGGILAVAVSASLGIGIFFTRQNKHRVETPTNRADRERNREPSLGPMRRANMNRSAGGRS